MTAWLVPTARATAWPPLAAVAVFLAVVSSSAANAGRWPLGLLGITAGAVAAAVVAGLRDPAAALLSAVPTSAAVRRVHRLALLVPAGTAVWLGHLWSGQPLAPGLGWPVAPLLALISCGVAVAVWAPARLGLTYGVAAPLVWAAASRAAGGLDKDVSEVLLAWQHHPWLVTVAAVAALLLGRNR
jgi:hypothetical protein